MRSRIILTALVLSLASQAAIAGETTTLSAGTTFVAAAEELSPQLETGTLLFSQGDCLAIRVYTASPYTHVAIVCLEEGKPMVYDSMNGIGVRRLPLADYFAAESPNQVHVFHPARSLTAEQGRLLEESLRSQLGRPYGIQHHLTGERAEGLHCAEYATDALMSIGLIRAKRPSRVSPASLMTGITRAEIYEAAQTIDLQPPELAQEPAQNGCHQLWIDTKQCTIACCDKLQGWFLCR